MLMTRTCVVWCKKPPWSVWSVAALPLQHCCECCVITKHLLLPHRRSYRKNEVIEENKALLKEKYTTAKALGKQVSSDAAYAISGFLHSTYIQRYSMYKDVLYTKIFIKKIETQWTAVEHLHHQQQPGENRLQGLLML